MSQDAKAALPPVVSEAAWRATRARLLEKEKAHTRAQDALAAERRRLPMVAIEKDYVFDGPGSDTRLIDLFAGRRQLLLYHFMYAPGVQGWPDAGCPGCSFFIDQIPHLSHLEARDISFALVSRAPLANIRAYQARMGWTIPWLSSEKNTFNVDFNITRGDEETHGLSVFLRDGERIFRTYFTSMRGTEALGSI